MRLSSRPKRQIEGYLLDLLWHPDHSKLKGAPWMPFGWRHITYSRLFRFLYPSIWRLLFRVRISATEKIPSDRGCIFVGNHGSHFDLFLMIGVLMRVSARSTVPVAWHRILDFPVIGPFHRSLQAVGIDHSDAAVQQRRDAVLSMVRHVREGRHLLILAEGRRSDSLGSFKNGAARVALETGAPIVPFTLLGVQSLFKRLDKMPKLWGRVEVVFHPPVEPSNYRYQEGPAAIMNEVRSRVASVLDYPDEEA